MCKSVATRPLLTGVFALLHHLMCQLLLDVQQVFTSSHLVIYLTVQRSVVRCQFRRRELLQTETITSQHAVGELTLYQLLPLPVVISSFSALTLLVGSFDP